MSLEFTGYSCTIKCNNQEIGSGFSGVGPLCSPTDALRLALENRQIQEMLEKTDSLYWTRNIQLEFLTGTCMPTPFLPELPKMYNLETRNHEYNRRIHSFMEDFKRLCHKHKLHIAYDCVDEMLYVEEGAEVEREYGMRIKAFSLEQEEPK